MANIELASAYVTLMPSMDGFFAKVNQEMASFDTSSAGKKAGSNYSNAFAKTMAGVTKIVSTSIGAIGGALGSMAASGGMARALNIQQAQTMFKGLKLEYEDFRQTIDDAVTGTAYSFDVAALVAANLAASGVQAGDQMAQALNGAVGTAATFGASLDEIGMIYQKVAATGKLSGTELMQLNVRGINALNVLSDYLGITADEVRSMVSAGKVDFQTFSDAMFAAFGESAQMANETFSGSMANMRSALSRIGQKFAEPLLAPATQTFNAIRLMLNEINTLLTPVSDSFASFAEKVGGKIADKLGNFTSKLAEVNKIIKETGAKPLEAITQVFGKFQTVIGIVSAGLIGISGAFGALSVVTAVIPGLSSLSGVVGAIFGGGGLLGMATGVIKLFSGALASPLVPIALLIGAFTSLMQNNEQFANRIGMLCDIIGNQFASAFNVIGNTAQTIANGAMPLLQSLFETFSGTLETVFTTLFTLFAQMAPVVSNVVETLAPIITNLIMVIINGANTIFSAIAPVIESICNMFIEYMPMINNAVMAVAEYIAQIWPQIRDIINSACELIATIIETVWPHVQNIIEAVIEDVAAIIEWAWPHIQNIIEVAMDAIQWVIDTVTAAINGDWSTVWNNICDVCQQIWDDICAIVEDCVNAVLETVKGIYDDVTSFFADAWNWLYQAGCDLIQGFIDGVASMVGAVVDAVSGFANSVIDTVTGIFGIHSPSRVFKEIGRQTMAGYDVGFKEGSKQVYATVENTGQKIIDSMWDYGYHAGVNVIEALADGISSSDATDKAMSEEDAKFQAYMDEMIGNYRSRADEFKEVSDTIKNYMWQVVSPEIMKTDWVKPAKGAVYDSMKVIEAAGYTYESYKNKLENPPKPDEEGYAEWIALNNKLSASFEEISRWQSMYTVKNDLIEGIERASSSADDFSRLFNKAGVVYSQNFVDRIVAGGDKYAQAINDMSHMTSSQIQQMVDSFDDLARAERLEEINQRSLWVNSLKVLNTTGKNAKDWLLDYRDTCLDIKEVIYSDAGLSGAFNKAGISIEEFAFDLQSLNMTMDDFVSGMNSFVDKVSNGFSQMTKYGKTGFDEWSQNLRLNMAESQAYADNLQKIFAILPDTVDSAAFRKAVLEGGFDQWGQVIADMSTMSADQIVSAIELYNESIVEAQQSAIEQFRALAPGEEYMLATIEGILGKKAEFTNTLVEASEEANAGMMDTYSSWVGTGSNLAGGIAAGIQSQIGAIASAAAATVEAAIAAAQEAADINSPSKIANKEIGQMITLGVANGISDATSYAERSMDAMIKDTLYSGSAYKSAYNDWQKYSIPTPVSTLANTSIRGGDVNVYATVRNQSDVDKLAIKISAKQDRISKSCGII